MKAEIKAEWLAALRSGTYRQGSGQLREVVVSDDGDHTACHCCLGVLCELMRPRIEGSCWIGQEERDFSAPGYHDESCWFELPLFVVREVSLPRGDPILRLPANHPLATDSRLHQPGRNAIAIGDGITLSRLNDAGLSFTEIADLIEQYVEVTP